MTTQYPTITSIYNVKEIETTTCASTNIIPNTAISQYIVQNDFKEYFMAPPTYYMGLQTRGIFVDATFCWRFLYDRCTALRRS